MGVNESVPTNEKTFGFRIYKLIKNGPLEKASLHELDDFIIPPDEMYQKKIPFCDWIKEKANQKVTLNVYSLSQRGLHPVEIQTNDVGAKEGILGGSVRYENYATANRKVWHVVKVKEGSFAKTQLNLREKEDYLIAMRPNQGDIWTLNRAVGNPLELFGVMIRANIGKECEFYIYNKKQGARAVNAKIDNNEFFEMGCDAAYGKLHEFPIANLIVDEEEKKLNEENGGTQII